LGIHVTRIPKPIWGPPIWFGDFVIPKSVWGSPNRFGDSCHSHPQTDLGIPDLVWGLRDRIPKPANLCVTEEKSKNTIPKPIWGLPELVWAGILRYSKSGSPIFGLVVLPIWGPTYVLLISPCWSGNMVPISSTLKILITLP
jgi:hypothetical protein